MTIAKLMTLEDAETMLLDAGYQVTKPGANNEKFYQVEDGWCETYTGRQFFFKPGERHNVNLLDCAHSLSMLCRYNGHTNKFYSVAEHTVLMANHVWRDMAAEFPDRHALAVGALTALHHDDSEYIIGDLIRPIKPLFPLFKKVEEDILMSCAYAFGFEYPLPDWLKELDSRIIVDERRQAMSDSGNDWGTDELKPLGVELQFWDPEVARQVWLTTHEYLQGQLGRRGNS